MTTHQVREISLQLRTSGSPEPTVRPRAEKFVADALEQLGDYFELRFPGRVVLIRTLPIHWRLTDKQIDSPTALADAVDQLISSIDVTVWPKLTPPPDEEEVVVFSDEAHWRACFAVAVSFGVRADAWYFKSLNAQSELWSFATRVETSKVANVQLLHSVLHLLAMEDLLSQVLGETTKSDLELIAGRLGMASSSSSTRPILSESHSDNDYNAMLQKGSEPKSEHLLDGLTPRLKLIRWITQQVGSIEDAWQLVSEQETLREATHIHTTDRNEPIDADVLGGETIVTQFAGLFYLLRVALELEIGEILWKACLPEGVILSEAAKLILGDVGKDDLAVLFFSGTTSVASSWKLSTEQHNEVCLALLESFVLAIPRRGLAEWPTTRVAMAYTPAGKLLTVVSADQLLFAWPVQSSNDLRQGLSHFLSLWPMSAPAPESTPDLAMLDGSGRIRSTLRKNSVGALSLFEVESLSHALVAQVAGMMCRLFSARLGREYSESQHRLVQMILKQCGAIRRSNDVLSIMLPMSSINLDVRKAGLDQDPGWIPWLDATVTFEFFQDSSIEG